MKNFLLPIVLLFSVTILGQSIVVDDPMTPQTLFTAEQMVTEVLIGGTGCGDVDFTFLQENPAGETDIDQRSWGYFDATGTAFPFESGILLSSGFAKSAQGPNDTSNVSDGTWGGDDADLGALLNAQSGDVVSTNDATVFQFTFVPVISELTFNFLFASDEYGALGADGQDQECSSNFRDGFAFLLRGPGIPDDSGTAFGGTNIAAVPGSTTPVSTISIHNDTFTCGPEVLGVNFFPEFYISNNNADNTDVVQFDGYTQPLTASASLIPGQTYELKMVIADRGDSGFDSAVFFEEGSFNIGVTLGPDATIVSGTAPCDAEEFEIGVEDATATGATYQWFQQNPTTGLFDIIAGATDPILMVTEPGVYQIEAALSPECTATDEIIVEFAPQPIANAPDIIRQCDEAPNDGLSIFNLRSRDAQIVGTQTQVVVSYFESEMDAIDGLNPIPDPTMYQNTMPGFQTVYAKLEDQFFNCFDIIELDIQVDNAPEITNPITDFFQCDNDENGIETVDLTSKDDEILNDLVNVTLEYYENAADAAAETNAIPDPTMFTSGFTTIFVVATNSLGCTTTDSFELILGDTPPFTAPSPLIGCDVDDTGTAEFDLNEKNDEITAGTPALSVRYFPSEALAQMGDEADQLMIPYISAGEIIWVRIEDDNTGCYSITTLVLTVAPLPDIFEPQPIVFCDTDNDGFGEFTLTDRDDEIRGGNPSGNLVVSYHETFGEADSNTNPLLSPYPNITPFDQLVYARLTDLNTGCYDITTLQLIVGDSPEITMPDDMILCDDDDDAIQEFNLTLSEAQMLDGLTGGPYTVNYYETQANADMDFNPIVNTTMYAIQPSLIELAPSPNEGFQVIYIVVADVNNGCSTQTILRIRVDLMPSLTPPDPLVACDTPTFGEQREEFNLTDATAQITGGDVNIGIQYFTSLADAEANMNAIPDPTAFVNDVDGMGVPINPQDIFIRAEDLTTGCINTDVTLEIIVENAPTPETPDPLVVCDDINNNGFAEFNLTDKDLEIIGLEPNVVISYFETQLDAENNTNVIDTTVPYQNIIAFMQTVYARAEFNPDTGCFAIVPLDLEVINSPVIPLPGELDPLIACDEDMDMEEVFNLLEQAAEILGTQDPDDFTLTFHENEMDAQAGTPQIANPGAYTNISNPQTIWYRLDTNDADNFCFAVGSFELQVADAPVINGPFQFEQCDNLDDLTDGIARFDLTSQSDIITGGTAGLNVQYFITEEDAELDTNPIINIVEFDNTTNPQTIYVRVTDSNTGCVAFTTVELRVVTPPIPNEDVELRLCDEITPGDGQEVFNLTDAEIAITGGNTMWQVGYFATLQDAEAGTPEIPDPTMFENTDSNPQIVYVLITNNNNALMCSTIVELPLIVDPLPDDSAVINTPLIDCQVNAGTTAVFDLTLKDEEVLGDSQSADDYTVTYYETMDEAIMMQNPITPANAYPVNLSVPGNNEVFVGIINNETGCYIGGAQSFFLEIREGAVANAPALPYNLCDAEGDNDGITVFDLSDPDLLAEILGGQDPTIYSVTFHGTFETADVDVIEDEIGPSYTNIINPQIIYVRVENDDTGCYDIAEVILNVEQLPFIALEESYRLCVDENGNPIANAEGEGSPPVLEIVLANPELYEIEWTLDGTVIEGQTGTSLIVVQEGDYTVTITEIATECTASTSTTVTVSSPPFNPMARLIDGAFSGNNTVEVTVEGIGDYEYSVDGGEFQESNIFENLQGGSRAFTVRDINGCGEITFNFGIIDYDKFFTPNEDGFNDTWKIDAIADFDPTANIYIFDRFGKLLKQLSVSSAGWDGTYNGFNLPSSDYWFRIEYTEDDIRKEFRSHFTLKR